MNFLSNNTMRVTEKSLDYLWKKQETISENIANADTPGYKYKYVTFEDELRKNLTTAKDQGKSKVREGIEKTKISIHTAKDETARLDGNNVNIDVENVEMARTSIQYQYALRSINDEITLLRTAIKG